MSTPPEMVVIESGKAVEESCASSFTYMPRKIVAFFCCLNPSNWFKEFADIKITLEEFDVPKNC